MAKKKSSTARPSELPDAEMEVLACLWQKGRATVREVREAIADYRPMAHGSVITLLKRLEAKNFVTKEKGKKGKAFIYKPARRPQPTYRSLVGNLVERVFGGSPVTLVSSLFESRPPTAEELKALQSILDQLRANLPARNKKKKGHQP